MRQVLSTVAVGERQTLLDTAVLADAVSNDQRQPAATRLMLGTTEASLPRFAPYEKSPDGQWRPTVQVAVVEAVVLVLGLTFVVCFDLGSGGISSLTSLFRTDNADRGWLGADLFSAGSDGVVLVYEGGAMLVARDGRLRWHIAKAWDDVLVGEPRDELNFMSGDEGAFTIRVRDGARR